MNSNTSCDYEAIQAAAAFIRSHDRRTPAVGIILGSGLGPVAESLEAATRIAYRDIPMFPTTTVQEHAGVLWLGQFGSRPVVVMQGRVHYYEGYPMAAVVFPARVLWALGAKAVIVTNAAGGVRPDFAPGDLMLIEDHLNLIGMNPLLGPNEPRFGTRFPDQSRLYPEGLRKTFQAVAQRLAIPLQSGIYAALSGPAYETPAEIRMLRGLGADAVGMSTVPEVMALGHLGVPVVGLSYISNKAAGLTSAIITHDEVAQVASRVKDRLARLLRAAVVEMDLAAQPAQPNPVA